MKNKAVGMGISFYGTFKVNENTFVVVHNSCLLLIVVPYFLFLSGSVSFFLYFPLNAVNNVYYIIVVQLIL